MKKWACTSESEFLELIRRSKKARDALIHYTTVKETYFFREPDFIDLLTAKLIPSLLMKKKRLRIISAGCSIGAEAYTLAIAIDSSLGAGVLDSCDILGIDIDPAAIEHAKRGVYTSYPLRGMPQRLLDSYFTSESDNTFTVKQHIQKHTAFSVVNLIEKQQLQQLPKADIIFYRNVSIYFDERRRPQVFSSLADLLTDEGILITSSSETIPHDIGILSLRSYHGLFYFSKEQPQPKPEQQLRRRHTDTIAPRRNRQQRTEESENRTTQRTKENQKAAEKRTPVQKALDMARKGSYSTALQLIAAIESTHGQTRETAILKAGIMLDKNQIKEARELCDQLLHEDPMLLEPHLILAIIHRLEGDPEKALSELKTVLYIDPECWMALYYSAEFYRQQQKDELAKRYYSRVIKSLREGTQRDNLLVFAVTQKTSQQIIRLCELGLTQHSP
jgi:chemotaxis protein methyltransferase CheR